ncbi:MAG: hypothetical protein JWP81_4339 [Ferruginibacter sp.]|nr:hypothetical protein [Ferruginibacter sp.]
MPAAIDISFELQLLLMLPFNCGLLIFLLCLLLFSKFSFNAGQLPVLKIVGSDKVNFEPHLYYCYQSPGGNNEVFSPGVLNINSGLRLLLEPQRWSNKRSPAQRRDLNRLCFDVNLSQLFFISSRLFIKKSCLSNITRLKRCPCRQIVAVSSLQLLTI